MFPGASPIDGPPTSMMSSPNLSSRGGVTKKQRAWTLGRALFDLWALVIDSRGVLLQYAGMVRLANPASLMVVGMAVVAGVLLIATAGAALVVSRVF